MKKNNYLLLAYYSVLFAVMATKVVQTVYAGSIFVHRSHQLEKLHAEKQILLENNSYLITQVSKENSLHSLLSSATLEGYSEISNPIVITDKAMVALK